MPDDFVIARNPEPGSRLPFLVRIPVDAQGIVLKVRETWPRTAKVYCHRAAGWPEDVEVVERVAVRRCERRGAAIDLVLDRGRENRSQFVITRLRGGREAIFWQSPRTTKQARPNVPLPSGRAVGVDTLEVMIDVHERYPYTFGRKFGRGQVRTSRQALRAGDYAVTLEGVVVAAVERKTLVDLAASLLDGTLRYAMAELASLPHAAVVVEDRYGRLFGMDHVRPSTVADALAEAQVRCPSVPIVFIETRALAEEWTYRFLAAGRRQAELDLVGGAVPLPAAGLLPARPPSTAEVRAWALTAGLRVGDRGRLRPEVWTAYRAAHGSAVGGSLDTVEDEVEPGEEDLPVAQRGEL